MIVPFLAQITLAVGLTGWFSLRNGQNAVNDVAAQLRQETVNRIEQKLDDYLETSLQANRFVQEAIRLGQIDPNQPEDFYRLFLIQSHELSSVRSIFYGQSNGEFIGIGQLEIGRYQQMRGGPSIGNGIRFYDIASDGKIRQLAPETPGWDTVSRPWYQAAAIAGKPVWGDIFTYHAFPVMALPASSPVYDDSGQLIGVVGNNFFLSQVNEFLHSLKIGKTGKTFILERSGQLVATSTQAQPFRVENGQTQRIEAAASEDPIIAATATYLLNHYGDFAALDAEIQLSFDLDGERQFLQVHPFQTEQGLDWLVMVVVPEADFMAQIQANTRHTIWLCVGALGIAVGSGIVTTRLIMRPLRQLGRASRAISDGDLQQQVPDCRLQEFNVLADTFNDMSSQLAESFKHSQQYQEDLKVINRELKAQASLFRLIADNMGDLVCLQALNGQYLYVSPSAEWIVGYPPEELIGQKVLQLIHPEDRDRVHTDTYLPALQGISTTSTYRIRHRSGEYIWLETITRPVRDDTNQIIRLQTTSRDVSEKVKLRHKLEHEALHDALTGLPNRNRLISRLSLALNRHQQDPNYRFAVVFLDLDHFKNVNDSLGHLVGDQMLLAMTQRLVGMLGATDLAARFGGDEFILLLDNITDGADAYGKTEQIIARLTAPIALENQEIFVTVSAGLVISDRHYSSPSELIRDADIAMFRAKTAGRDQIQQFTSAMRTRLLAQVQLERELRKALTDYPEEFVLYYQPIVALQDLSVRGFEALVRWQHPHRGLIPPDRFISIAEESGLILPLGKLVLQQACRQIKTWCDQFQLPDLTISVNLSVAQLQDANLLDQIDQTLDECDLSGDRLTLEITESMVMGD
ncbi:PAS domain S-box protein, partial [filamentous cyanobacterium CCP5]